jgi:ADP-heptose:LPS heptosyltransferase
VNVKVLQRVDQWFGVPLCFILSVTRMVFGRFFSTHSGKPRNILVVKLAEQGSTVLAYAALRRATELVGREHVYFFAFENNRFILDLLDVIPKENVVTVPAKGLSPFLLGMLSAIRRVRRLKFDAAIDMEFFSRGTAALTFLSGAKQRVGFHAFFGAGPYRGDLMTHRLLYNPHLHTSQTFLTLVDALLCDPAKLPTFAVVPPESPVQSPMFVPGADERAQVEAMLPSEKGSRPPVILLNPNASDLLPLRRWPNERYLELARRLLDKYPEVRIGLTGAPEEAGKTSELVRQVNSDRCISFAGRTTLRQLLILYTLAEVLVTNDSGPAHFATLTPIHVVTLFGPETPALFAARTPRNTVLWANLACSPCVSAYNNRLSSCRDNQCMQSITVDQVFAAVCRAYANRMQDRKSVSACV